MVRVDLSGTLTTTCSRRPAVSPAGPSTGTPGFSSTEVTGTTTSRRPFSVHSCPLIKARSRTGRTCWMRWLFTRAPLATSPASCADGLSPTIRRKTSSTMRRRSSRPPATSRTNWPRSCARSSSPTSSSRPGVRRSNGHSKLRSAPCVRVESSFHSGSTSPKPTASSGDMTRPDSPCSPGERPTATPTSRKTGRAPPRGSTCGGCATGWWMWKMTPTTSSSMSWTRLPEMCGRPMSSSTSGSTVSSDDRCHPRHPALI